MRPVLLTLLSSLVVVPALWALGGEADVPTAGRYRVLLREYQDAQRTFYKTMREAKTDADRRKALSGKPSPREFAERFLALAKAEPKAPAAFDALNWVLTYSANGPEADEALVLLARDHVDGKRLGPVLQRLATSRSPDAEALLRAAKDKSPRREVQAQACYALASLLAAKAKRPAAEDPGDDAKTKTEGEPRKPPREEAEAVFEELAGKYGEMKAVRKKTYGDLARAGLARLRPKSGQGGSAADADPATAAEVGLEVGMAAPPIEGLDTNGRPMRLGEYRGTVVVLDFWGHW